MSRLERTERAWEDVRVKLWAWRILMTIESTMADVAMWDVVVVDVDIVYVRGRRTRDYAKVAVQRVSD